MRQSEITPLSLGIPGQPWDDSTARLADRVTALSEESTASIPFGIMVVNGAGEDGAVLPSSLADIGNLRGISMSNEFRNSPNQVDATGVKPGHAFSCARTGRWIVRKQGAVTKGGPVHVRVVAEEGGPAGYFLPGDDGVKTIDVSAFASWWCDSAAEDELGVVEIDMPNQALATADS